MDYIRHVLHPSHCSFLCIKSCLQHPLIHLFFTRTFIRIIQLEFDQISLNNVYYNETYEAYNFSNSAITPFYFSIKIYIQEKKKTTFSLLKSYTISPRVKNQNLISQQLYPLYNIYMK